ncbi:MAG: hypothetical protein V3W09_03835 [Nitrososphaerales archaeon]
MARISKKVQEITAFLQPEKPASFVVNKYVTWRNHRTEWNEDMKELRNYIFQTDTQSTSNRDLPWKNTTSTPKICQIRDNLHANYMAALFPSDDWFKWEAATQDAATKTTADLIEAYMKQKIRESEFKTVMSEALYDYIDYGNAFGEVTYENDVHQTPDGLAVAVYSGPKAHRISPYDIYFDQSAPTFQDAAKITRTVVSMGSLLLAAEIDPAFAWVKGGLEDTKRVRMDLSTFTDSDIDKAEGFQIDGFGNISGYYSSDMVELLEYEGDTFNKDTGEIQTNRRIIVMDRRVVVSDEPINSWLGKSNKEHVGWRLRPDNLMAMGPLDNLVGMQYRLDHLENLKADVFDQIAHPVVYQRGLVEDWEWGPGEKIFGDVDSNVEVLSPDATALNAEFQKQQLMQDMEQLVGAPREAMGIRTPGEKTAFEVAELQNAAGRLFQQKITWFEEHFVEPLLNQMLESARRNINSLEIIKVLDEDFAVQQFLKITPEIIGSKGKLYPMGARHFAKQAQNTQNLLGLLASPAYQDPAVSAHISGFKIAELMEEQLGLQKFDLVQNNIRVTEQQRTQSLATQAADENVGEIADRALAEEELPLEEEELVDEQPVV